MRFKNSTFCEQSQQSPGTTLVHAFSAILHLHLLLFVGGRFLGLVYMGCALLDLSPFGAKVGFCLPCL